MRAEALIRKALPALRRHARRLTGRSRVKGSVPRPFPGAGRIGAT